MKTLLASLALVLVAAITVTGCTTENVTNVTEVVGGETPIRLGTVDPAIIGKWQIETGKMFPDIDTWVIEATAFEFTEDGYGYVFFKNRYTGAISKSPMYCVYDGQKLVIDLTRTPLASSYYADMWESYPVVVIDEDELTVADDENRITMFVKQTTLPADVAPQPFPYGSSYSVPQPGYFSDLVNYAGDLVYSDSGNNVQHFDLGTKTMQTPLGVLSSRIVQASRLVGPSTRFWAHCGCGGSRDAYDVDYQGTYDTIQTSQWGEEITIRAAEWLPTTNRLWLHGREMTSQIGQFLIVNPAGEPDGLDERVNFNMDLNGLTFDGQSLWAIGRVVGLTLIQIDPTTKQVIGSYELPDDVTYWSGIAAAPDGEIYLLGFDLDGGDGTIIGTQTAVSVPEGDGPTS